MDTGADIICGGAAASHRQVVPFAEVLVTLTKEQEIKLRCEASFWRSQHRQALVRLGEGRTAQVFLGVPLPIGHPLRARPESLGGGADPGALRQRRGNHHLR
ncbi:MAG: hypothetical protein DVS81_15710, partial [Candidatus Accumulibacter meliphilus]